MATLLEITVDSILLGTKYLPSKIKNIIVTGGGHNNKYLIKRLREKLDTIFVSETDIDINFDYIESELIAFLSARSFYNLPITFPSTTGVSKTSSGGKLYKYL